MKNFNGEVLFLDRDDINTDEIIPAKYLTELTKDALKPFLLEDLKLDGFDPGRDLQGKTVIITRENFGCGSSREHAPWALEVNGINLVIAVNFARIFKQNMFNNGMMAIDLNRDVIEEIFSIFKGNKTNLVTNLDEKTLTVTNDKTEKKYNFSVSEFDRNLVESGGWVGYANSHY